MRQSTFSSKVLEGLLGPEVLVLRLAAGVVVDHAVDHLPVAAIALRDFPTGQILAVEQRCKPRGHGALRLRPGGRHRQDKRERGSRYTGRCFHQTSPMEWGRLHSLKPITVLVRITPGGRASNQVCANPDAGGVGESYPTSPVSGSVRGPAEQPWDVSASARRSQSLPCGRLRSHHRGRRAGRLERGVSCPVCGPRVVRIDSAGLSPGEAVRGRGHAQGRQCPAPRPRPLRLPIVQRHRVQPVADASKRGSRIRACVLQTVCRPEFDNRLVQENLARRDFTFMEGRRVAGVEYAAASSVRTDVRERDGGAA